LRISTNGTPTVRVKGMKRLKEIEEQKENPANRQRSITSK
jgi:hypothetical protein